MDNSQRPSPGRTEPGGTPLCSTERPSFRRHNPKISDFSHEYAGGVRFAYQCSSALVGIAITGEAGDRNGRHAGLEIQAQVSEFITASQFKLTIGFSVRYPKRPWWYTDVLH